MGAMTQASVLTCPIPDFPQAAAEEAALRHFGLSGDFRRLTSERDVNWHISGPAGEFVLKLTNPAEPAEVTDFQTRAHLHLEPFDLPVPRLRRALDGAVMVRTGAGILRALTYLPGRMMHQAQPSAGLRRSIGAMNARLSRGFAGFSHPAARHSLQWDVRHTGALRPYLDDLPPDLRAPVSAFVLGFEDRFAARLKACRWQVVHNDLNPHNVLVSNDGARVAGVLDFGDMVETPLICDLGVTASYQLDPAAPLDSLLDFARAYHAKLPLTGPEARLILPMTMARWATTLCITAHRAARYPENAAYILRNVPQARAGFLAALALEEKAAEARILKELELS